MEQGIDSVSLNPDSAAWSRSWGFGKDPPNKKDDKNGELIVKVSTIGIFHQEVGLKRQTISNNGD